MRRADTHTSPVPKMTWLGSTATSSPSPPASPAMRTSSPRARAGTIAWSSSTGPRSSGVCFTAMR